MWGDRQHSLEQGPGMKALLRLLRPDAPAPPAAPGLLRDPWGLLLFVAPFLPARARPTEPRQLRPSLLGPEVPCHAESRLLEQIQSWDLDPKLHYRVTCFLSWSPCTDCAQDMAQFLKENSHVSLSLFASRLYTRGHYDEGLRTLKRAGASMAIMTSREFEHCWNAFVHHKGNPFQPWPGLATESQKFSEKLQRILRISAALSGPKGCPSLTQDPMEWIRPGTFFFHFPSLLYAYGRKSCYLCFQVKREGEGPPSYDWGVFKNKVYFEACYHAEFCFLSWFCDQNLSPDEHYHVTWFLSWSPCPTCAEEVVRFLREYRNVTLSIFTARLYYFWHPHFQDGLYRLWSAGVHLDIMSFEDYEYCWDTFVDHNGMRFQSWDLLRDNDFLATELENILRTTMSPLQQEIFFYQFGNQPRAPKPYHRRKTYLCYQLKTHEGHITAKVCLQNKKKRHAEIRFIDNIMARKLEKDQRFEITCYVTWSPCPTCAKELVAFARKHSHISLRLFASRLYFHWLQENKQGLKHLHASGIPVAVMSSLEFEDCWKEFVDNQGKPFQPWNKLEQYSKNITRRLQKILKPQNDLENEFRNLHL
uniref:DNA dC->dU-editing enzyme APOBEC-3B n=1 Tax=Odobenus rosmarus divergens TaxID=9708 RepID=UPI00063C4E13|nr:PREDICTED: DNA dC->dU-editing enzyme APOBEC-3B [Odobenus rosmarus divergens]